ncbi:hypothetical protein CSW08_14755 [Confluentibacter flavum]|uniref:Uncharacterized protein n=1 Tax=Confluentibacter flavum TaxID=1909700 RepID=A0A2N3HGM0_9FLAO|nr:hypothetical protein CSW08_14755 [Confluentibacter flavum]
MTLDVGIHYEKNNPDSYWYMLTKIFIYCQPELACAELVSVFQVLKTMAAISVKDSEIIPIAIGTASRIVRFKKFFMYNTF